MRRLRSARTVRRQPPVSYRARRDEATQGCPTGPELRPRASVHLSITWFPAKTPPLQNGQPKIPAGKREEARLGRGVRSPCPRRPGSSMVSVLPPADAVKDEQSIGSPRGLAILRRLCSGRKKRPLGVHFPKGLCFRLRTRPAGPAFACRSSPAEVTRLPPCTRHGNHRRSQTLPRIWCRVNLGTCWPSTGYVGKSEAPTPSREAARHRGRGEASHLPGLPLQRVLGPSTFHWIRASTVQTRAPTAGYVIGCSSVAPLSPLYSG